jgi:hypothetical protein
MANDTFELASKLVKGVTERETLARKHDLKLYHSPDTLMSISPLYSRYIGDTVTIAFNGNFKKFPVNGEQFRISRGHRNALTKYLRHIDRQIRIAQTNVKFMDTQHSGDFKRM